MHSGTFLLLPLSQILNIKITDRGIRGQKLEFRIAEAARGHEALRQNLSSHGPTYLYPPNEDDPHHLLSILKYGTLTIDIDVENVQSIVDWTNCLKRNALKGWNHILDVVMDDVMGRLRIVCDEDGLSLVKGEMSEIADTDLDIRAVSIDASEETADEERPPSQQPLPKDDEVEKQVQNGNEEEMARIEDPATVTTSVRRKKLDDEDEEFLIHDDSPMLDESPSDQIAIIVPPIRPLSPTETLSPTATVSPRETQKNSETSQQGLYGEDSPDAEQRQEKRPVHRKRRRLTSAYRSDHYPPPFNRYNTSPTHRNSYSSRTIRRPPFSPSDPRLFGRNTNDWRPGLHEDFAPGPPGAHAHPPQMHRRNKDSPPHYRDQRYDAWPRQYRDERPFLYDNHPVRRR